MADAGAARNNAEVLSTTGATSSSPRPRAARCRWPRIAILFAVAPAGPIAYLLLWPVDVRPLAWQPPPAPDLSGPYAVNSELADAQPVLAGIGVGPETTARDAQGRLYAGLLDGRILRFNPDGTNVETFADTGGRPLGLAFDALGDLIVCDATRGLLRVSADGASVTVLADSHDGVPFRVTNDLDIASDGTIYFTDASSRRALPHYEADFLEQRGYGRLLAYDPVTQRTTLLLDGLEFANGVALGPGEEYALVVETGRYRVQRYWLKGEKQGSAEVFIENLPGFPDGIAWNGRDRFWLAIAAPRNALLDACHPRPWAKKILARLPDFLKPSEKRHGMAIAINADGEIVANLQDPGGEGVSLVSSVEEWDGWLYFGSYSRDVLMRHPVPK